MLRPFAAALALPVMSAEWRHRTVAGSRFNKWFESGEWMNAGSVGGLIQPNRRRTIFLYDASMLTKQRELGR
jgi:hypothetical protein